MRVGHLYYNIGYMAGPSLGDFELTVVLAVSRLGADAYGLRIWREVNALRRHDYVVGAIYTTLQRLEDKGFLDSTMSEPLPVRGGRSRRQYKVTAVGRRALRAAQEYAARVWGSIDSGPTPA